MRLANLINPAFGQAMVKLNKQQLPLKTAFKLKDIIKKVEEEQRKYDEVRGAALHRYGKRNDDGSLKADENGNVELDGEAAKSFVNEVNELLSLEIDVPTISVTELGDNIVISSEELFLLDFIIRE